MFSEAGLILWSAAGLTWSVLSWRLVGENRPPVLTPEDPAGLETISIFKPLPPLDGQGLEPFAPGLESFLAQIGERDELLLGVHAADVAEGNIFAARMQALYPRAVLKLIPRSEPDTVPNPKVAWQKILAPHARGELWLWSDADIVAPPGYLASARSERHASGARMLTSPYVVRATESAPALLDALFVNVEFFPGVLLLRRFGPVDFGLGAAMLFSAADFHAQVGWSKIGPALADDFVLGRNLRPVQIGTMSLATRADESNWKQAVLHYLRWSKTVRWNRPGGTAARLFVLPVLGWLAYCCAHPASSFGWLGLFLMMQLEIFFAVLIFRRIGCSLKARDGLTLEIWTLWRCLVWCMVWFPWPVTWRGQKWNSPYLNEGK